VQGKFSKLDFGKILSELSGLLDKLQSHHDRVGCLIEMLRSLELQEITITAKEYILTVAKIKALLSLNLDI
jgi:hypothetical protein